MAAEIELDRERVQVGPHLGVPVSRARGTLSTNDKARDILPEDALQTDQTIVVGSARASAQRPVRLWSSRHENVVRARHSSREMIRAHPLFAPRRIVALI